VNARAAMKPARLVPLLLCGALLAAPAAPGAGSRYFDVVDTDHDGRISLAEYQERMSWAFRQMDANRDGVLAPSEQLVPAPTTTLAELQARLERQFRRQDSNRDGWLSAREFLAPPA
jgi:Ca2+-binding EF-hand superfamily protein